MLADITLGQYFPGDSPVHRVDPRVKIVLAAVFVTAVFFVKGFIGYGVLALFIAGVTLLARLKPSFLLRSLKPVLYVMLFTFILNAFFSQGETEIFRFYFIRLTSEGLRQAAFLALRLVFLVAGTSLLTLTTSPIALTDALERLFNPFKRVGLPVHELSMMMVIALRFIPTLLEETDKIMKAQMARGADFESGNVLKRAKAMVPLLVPLFVSAFRRADELAVAMEARCYHGGEGRTRMKILKLAAVDAYACALTCVTLALVLLV